MNQAMLLRVSVYALGVALGALVSLLIAAHWLDLISGWSASLLGGAFGFLGVFLSENIGDALIFSVVGAVLLTVFISQVSGLLVLKGVAISIVVGLCAGKLVGGVWNEMVA